ncbi:MAG TPA: metallophosphoesterase [Thermoanaerobaculia bacterium]|nr:metallophosphoesterase [Thermoanaerobaculia bacterium]
MAANTIRIGAVGDLHYRKTSGGMLNPLFTQVSEHADILLLCGDMTDYGLPEEARLLAQDLKNVKVPMLAVLGNHDHEAGQEEEVVRILTDAGVTILDGDAVEVRGIGFAGAKGFAGGFGRRSLSPWGEAAIKNFVQEAINEALKLERALAGLRTENRVVLLHYSPIQGTVVGEPPEIVPFLGSSRLEEPLIRYRATAVFHGHAHHGSLEGKTKSGIPVYNVCLQLLQKEFPDRIPIRVIELQTLPAGEPQSAAVGESSRGGVAVQSR